MSFAFHRAKCENNTLIVGGTSWSLQETTRESPIKKWNHHITFLFTNSTHNTLIITFSFCGGNKFWSFDINT